MLTTTTEDVITLLSRHALRLEREMAFCTLIEELHFASGSLAHYAAHRGDIVKIDDYVQSHPIIKFLVLRIRNLCCPTPAETNLHEMRQRVIHLAQLQDDQEMGL